ncbi:MAG: 3-hydroxyacyl-CoA dehydrogenase family protein [Planctomycetes bacterium]|nr:3-hydroxyacyl-CoA dehydrogenase family protein [Planctomycetota bacterium]
MTTNPRNGSDDAGPNAPGHGFARVTVIGSGTMGSGIAQVCAQSGAQVVLADVAADRVEAGLATILRFLDKGIERGKVTPSERDATMARITTATDAAAAASEADLVIEAVPENLDLKRRIFTDVAARCRPDAVLATNTSSLSLAAIFAGLPQPERCIGMHFFNPVPIMALLEIVTPAATDDAVVQRVRAYASALQKEPIVVRDSPGFATSRLGVCIGLEAIRMVEQGVASAADIDKAMELGYRHPMGPLRLTDLVGLDVRLAIAEYLCRELPSPVFEPPQLLRDKVARGELGKKSGKGFYDWTE